MAIEKLYAARRPSVTYSILRRDTVTASIMGKHQMRFSVVLHVAVAMTLVSTASGHAQKKYDPGASDTEIKLGQTLPYSGPVSVLSGVGKGETAYFKYLKIGRAHV